MVLLHNTSVERLGIGRYYCPIENTAHGLVSPLNPCYPNEIGLL